MTTPDPKLEQDADRIAAELAALGEDPLGEDDEALAFALSNVPDIDVATIQTMAETVALLSMDTDAEDAELSELAQARVWRTIELRTKSLQELEVDAKPRQQRSSTRPVVLGVVVALLAVAAGVLLVPVLTPSGPKPEAPIATAPRTTHEAPAISAEELEVLSTQARASLAALDRLSGESRGSARAQAMADAYARRLEAEG